MYQVIYAAGKKTKQGELQKGGANVGKMREEYQSLAKKSLQGKEFMKRYDMTGET
jgi:hypothetical protein